MRQESDAEITVVKLNSLGQEKWRYSGRIIFRNGQSILLEAFFNREDTDVGGMMLCEGDRFLEIFYSYRWYNIFEIYNGRTGQLKGWYCNLTAPAIFTEGMVKYRDLALDLLVFPDGRRQVLDEDEFLELQLSPLERKKTLQALKALEAHFSSPRFCPLAARYLH